MTDRKKHWEQVYTNKSPLEVSWYQQEPAISLSMVQDSVLNHTQPILDVGGGASMLVDRLLECGYTNLSVLDVSKNALQHARERLGDQANKVEWFEKDITEFAPPHQFTCWHDRAVFHFLTDAADRKKYIEALSEALKPGGYLVLAAFSLDGPTMCSGLDIVQYNAEKIGAELGDNFKLIEEVSESHITPAQKEQLFIYYRFVRV